MNIRSNRLFVLALTVLAVVAILSAPLNAATSPARPNATLMAAQVGISVSFGPPALPIYAQPPLPGPGYIWVPGYWAYADNGGYYWVPGTWVLAPQPGFLWTPCYWGWGGSAFIFYPGYWGPTVGFYGGINYGFGYFGRGYQGGRWRNGQFYYNRSVTNITNVTNIHNVYNARVSDNGSHISYNGGEGGVNARPTAEEEAAAREKHIPPVAAQTQQERAALANPQQRASANHGKPPIAATPRPGAFSGREVVGAKDAGAPYKAPAARATEQGANRGEANAPGSHSGEFTPRTAPPVHAKDLPPLERPAAPNTGNPDLDKKYQQQQQDLYSRQNQERQQLQKQQDQDHQRAAQQKANDAKTQQMEQRHQQQTQQMQQRHTQERQQLQQRQQQAMPRGGSSSPSREGGRPPEL